MARPLAVSCWRVSLPVSEENAPSLLLVTSALAASVRLSRRRRVRHIAHSAAVWLRRDRGLNPDWVVLVCTARWSRAPIVGFAPASRGGGGARTCSPRLSGEHDIGVAGWALGYVPRMTSVGTSVHRRAPFPGWSYLPPTIFIAACVWIFLWLSYEGPRACRFC